ncbi:hypothetical protein AUEXF2481DRAFT_63339 [Aureobasidium subglaciale EXF-2481]|uniref:STAS domain-containing protein n=1 Tax=Aureobasidium subglaciale (strain EXF-2481) TaxID=1043005 RepID=A0A074ZGU1_AURSE|nr:uncharacterized protein AUEXF2481DRAFT_63339 [Aureobasidium subglaciale EXF-2481]KEQ97776.1 hypothetical protein AUEXF2481DRAFT_63339 [Aureobasidium subglaciale EXF-2481]
MDPRDGFESGTVTPHSLLDDNVSDPLLRAAPERTMSTTRWLAKQHGVKSERTMYLHYYLPVTNWIRQYQWKFLRGDLIAALTMASFYIPMSLSYASNLAHLPPINGLYAFVFNPFIYAIFGTVPQLVVGPEAAGSLLTGQVVRENISSGKHRDNDIASNTQIAGMVTGIAGAIILLAGLFRLGFLDSVLSRPFLRGFISAIGVVIFVDQLVPETGMSTLIEHDPSGAAHGSSLTKLIYLFNNADKAHKLTCAVSFGAFTIVMVFRQLKRSLQPRYPSVAYFPDRFLVVVFSALFTWGFSWDKQGLDILGDLKTTGKPFQVHFPFQPSMMEHVTDAFSTSFLIALLGFFESSVAAKSLANSTAKIETKIDDDGNEYEEADGIVNMNVSANRELVALGVANIFGGLFMGIPAFGGYGRSLVNKSTGGKTPMSSVFLSLITVFCILFLLPYFYYIPKGVLAAMISVVAYSLIEEAPHDIHFFWSIKGWNEVGLMLLIFLTTFFWNLRIGIAVGIGLSLLRLLKHATRPRIQILGRVPGTRNQFDSAEHGGLEFIPYVLIVRIPEPLTFANTGSLKDRLRRLEAHGTSAAHPALPQVRDRQHNRNVVFDIHGVTSLDPAAAQVLLEIVTGYRERGTKVFFCRVPSRRSQVWKLMVVSGIVEVCGGEGHFTRGVEQALELSEQQERAESLREDSGSVEDGRAATT